MKPEEASNNVQKIKNYMCAGDPMWDTTVIEQTIDTAIDALQSKLDEREIWKISSVFQNYYCMGISEIAEEDEVCCSLFEKLGLI